MTHRLRRLGALVLMTAVATSGVVLVQASPAMAICATKPATNPIFIDTGDGNVIVIPGTPEATFACADVEGDPAPQIDTDPTVVLGEGCGVPCFAVGWGGVTTQPVTLTVWVNTNPPTMIQQPILGGTIGSFCVNSGVSC